MVKKALKAGKSRPKLPPKTLQVYGVLGDARGVVSMSSILSEPPLGKSMKKMRHMQNKSAMEKYTQEVVKLPHLQIIETGNNVDRSHLSSLLTSPKPEEWKALRSRNRVQKLENKRLVNERDAARRELKEFKLQSANRDAVGESKEYCELKQQLAVATSKLHEMESERAEHATQLETFQAQVSDLEEKAASENLIMKQLEVTLQAQEPFEPVKVAPDASCSDVLRDIVALVNTNSVQLQNAQEMHENVQKELMNSKLECERLTNRVNELEEQYNEVDSSGKLFRASVYRAIDQLCMAFNIASPDFQHSDFNVENSVRMVLNVKNEQDNQSTSNESSLGLVGNLELLLGITSGAMNATEPSNEDSTRKLSQEGGTADDYITDKEVIKPMETSNIVLTLEERLQRVTKSVTSILAQQQTPKELTTLSTSTGEKPGDPAQVANDAVQVANDDKSESTIQGVSDEYPDDTVQVASDDKLDDEIHGAKEQSDENSAKVNGTGIDENGLEQNAGETANGKVSNGVQSNTNNIDMDGHEAKNDQDTVTSSNDERKSNQSAVLSEIQSLMGIKNTNLEPVTEIQEWIHTQKLQLEEKSSNVNQLESKIVVLEGQCAELESKLNNLAQVEEQCTTLQSSLDEANTELSKANDNLLQTQEQLQSTREKLMESEQNVQHVLQKTWLSLGKLESDLPSTIPWNERFELVHNSCSNLSVENKQTIEKLKETSTQLETTESENDELRVNAAAVMQAISVLTNSVSDPSQMNQDDRLLVEENAVVRPLLEALDKLPVRGADTLNMDDVGNELEMDMDQLFGDAKLSPRDSSNAEQSQWKEMIDNETGNVYYSNIITGETQWNKPDDF